MIGENEIFERRLILIVFGFMSGTILLLASELAECVNSEPKLDKESDVFGIRAVIQSLKEDEIAFSPDGWVLFMRYDNLTYAFFLEERWNTDSIIDFNNEQKGDEE